MNNDILLSSDDQFEVLIYELLEADIGGTQSPLLTDDLNSDFDYLTNRLVNEPSYLN